MSIASISNNSRSLLAVAVLVGIAAVAWVLLSQSKHSGIASYYPLQVGNTWSYQITQRGHTSGAIEVPETTRLETVEQRVVGVSRLSSDELEVFEVSQKVDQPGSADNPAPPTESVLHLSAAPTAIVLHAVDAQAGGGSGLPAPIALLTDPPAIEPVTSEQGSLRLSLTVTSQELEGVEVPAGNFPNALKKVVEGPVSGAVSGLPIHVGTIRETTWFAGGVGIVRQDRVLEYTLKSQEGAEVHVQESVERVLTDFSPGTTE